MLVSMSAIVLLKPSLASVVRLQQSVVRAERIARCFLSTTVSGSSSHVKGDDRHDNNDTKMSQYTQSLMDDMLLPDQGSDVGDVTLQSTNVWKRRRALAQAITLVESRKPIHQKQAAVLLSKLAEHQSADSRNSSFRLGLAGPPGAGKSTFLEALGKLLLSYNDDNKERDSGDDKCTRTMHFSDSVWVPNKIAVVCIDPSSSITGGSILGDKTRMTELSRHKRAFVRPAPSSGTLGGLAAYTDDVVTMCQVAGYDLVTVETVGLGQSEVEVAQSVDMLILLVPPGGGDDLQGVKKGIIEVADMLVVTKADGALLSTAKHTASDYKGAVQFVNTTHKLEGWERPPVLLASSYTGDGIKNIWEHVSKFRQDAIKSGALQRKRQRQSHYWMWKNLQSLVQERTSNDEKLQKLSLELEEKLDCGKITPRLAAAKLLDCLTSR